jgi:hypothetical protein
MKLTNLFFIVLSILFISCDKKDDNSELTKKDKNLASYNQSIAKWNELKKINGNSYLYETRFYTWVGYNTVTELKIEEGTVTARAYKEFKRKEGNGQEELIYSYNETKDSLGSHEKGAGILTIDDLYNSCVSKYLIVDEKANTISFETNDNGLMSFCGFVPKDCQDDCFKGVRINSFKWID